MASTMPIRSKTMSYDPTLEDLASTINAQVQAITQSLGSTNLPQPSFSLGGPRSRDDWAPEASEARMKLIEAAQDIISLAMGPEEFWMTVPALLKHDNMLLRVLGHYSVFDAVPIDGSPITYEELSKQVGIPQHLLRRFIRLALANRIFWAPSIDTIAHTGISKEIATHPLHYDWLLHNVEEVAAGDMKVVEAMQKWHFSDAPNECAMSLAVPGHEHKGLFELFNDDGEGDPPKPDEEYDRKDRRKGWRSRRFGNAMKDLMSGGSYLSSHVHAGFDWDSLGKATVVDVGGSVGHVAIEIASRHPELTLIVQDFPNLAPQFKTTVPGDLVSRVTFQGYDFFTPQTVKHADVYFLKHILHDWSDVNCRKILTNVAIAMKPGNRIIIMESLVPEVGEVPMSLLKRFAAYDMQMLVACNSIERREREWTALIESVAGLKVKAFRQPPGSSAGLVEVMFEG